MATQALVGRRTLELPGCWVETWNFEKPLVRCGDVLCSLYQTILMGIPPAAA